MGSFVTVYYLGNDFPEIENDIKTISPSKTETTQPIACIFQ